MAHMDTNELAEGMVAAWVDRAGKLDFTGKIFTHVAEILTHPLVYLPFLRYAIETGEARSLAIEHYGDVAKADTLRLIDALNAAAEISAEMQRKYPNPSPESDEGDEGEESVTGLSESDL